MEDYGFETTKVEKYEELSETEYSDLIDDLLEHSDFYELIASYEDLQEMSFDSELEEKETDPGLEDYLENASGTENYDHMEEAKNFEETVVTNYGDYNFWEYVNNYDVIEE